MSSNDIFKVQGQIQGLELVLKTLISLQLAGRVKEDGDFAKMAQFAGDLRDRLCSFTDNIGEEAQRQGFDAELAEIMVNEMRGTVSRCFSQPQETLEEVSKIALELADAPSDARN